MPLFFVQDEMAAGGNSDLFINAANEIAAVQLWRDYFDLGAINPARVCIVPVNETAPGAVDWDQVRCFYPE